MTSTYFTVQTPRGWVGQSTTRGNLVDTMPPAFAYCYDTADDAARIAAMFEGATVVQVG